MFARLDLRAKKHRAELIKSFLERHGFEDVRSPRSLDESLQLHYGVLMFLFPQRVGIFCDVGTTKP